MKMVTATAAESIEGVITKGNLYDGIWVKIHIRTAENPMWQNEESLVIIGEDGGAHSVTPDFISKIEPRHESQPEQN